MVSSISNENPIWQLTPTELNVAYLSLTLSKKEISTSLVMSESAVGTHLGNVYRKLGLSEFPDDEKRLLLIDNFGQAIETIVKEVNGDYNGEYRRLRKEAQAKKSDVLSQKTSNHDPLAGSGMSESPPDARQSPERQRRLTPEATLSLQVIAFIAVLGVLIFGLSRLSEGNFEIQNPTQTIELIRSPTATKTRTRTPSPPALTLTPTIPPTAVRLPIREDFSRQYGYLWRVIGNPIVTDSGEVGRFSGGILTVAKDETATLWIGNTAWTNYVVVTRAYPPLFGGSLTIGVRVKDLNNMVALSCKGNGLCSWVFVQNGVRDTLPTEQMMALDTQLTITVEGDTILAVGDPTIYDDPTRMSIVIPPKYKDKFPAGGVLFQFTSLTEIDFIEIEPLP